MCYFTSIHVTEFYQTMQYVYFFDVWINLNLLDWLSSLFKMYRLYLNFEIIMIINILLLHNFVKLLDFLT